MQQDDTLSAKLMGPIGTVIERHRSSILPLLGSGGNVMQEALRNDEVVRNVACVTYALLPGLVRFAVKEPVYIDFVLAHREKVLGKLVASN
jgi:hypothetical protein